MSGADDPPDSLAFDALWGDPEPTPVPMPVGKVVPPPLPAAVKGPSPPEPQELQPDEEEPTREEDRATIAPPVPPSEYVRQMMAIGELDDPDLPPPREPLPTLTADLEEVWRRAVTPPGGLPLMATESELTIRLAEGGDEPPPSHEFPGPARRLGGGRTSSHRGLGRIEVRASPPSPPLPIAPVPRLAPVFGAGELDTLDGIGPLAPDLFDDPRGGLSAATNLAPKPAPVPPSPPPGDRRPTPTGLRLRASAADLDEPSFAVDHGVDEDDAPGSFDQRVADMRALLAANNFSSALVVAESVLVSDPAHAVAQHCIEACRAALSDKYLSSLGGRGVIPRVAMGPEEIRWLSLDHRSGFLLSFVDGMTPIDDVLDVSSMPELDALRILFELRTQGVIDIVEPQRRRR